MVRALGKRPQTMACRAVGLGMLETSTQAPLHSLSVHPSQGDEMEKGLLMQDLWMAFAGGVFLGWCIGKADWKGLWWN